MSELTVRISRTITQAELEPLMRYARRNHLTAEEASAMLDTYFHGIERLEASITSR